MSDLFGNHIVGFPTRRLINVDGQTPILGEPETLTYLDYEVAKQNPAHAYLEGISTLILSKRAIGVR